MAMFTWIKEKANNKFVQFTIYLVVFFGIAILVCNVPYIKEFLGDAYAQTLATLIATLPVIAALMVQTKSLTLQTDRRSQGADGEQCSRSQALQ